MAKYLEIARCSGQGHGHFTIQRTAGNTIVKSVEMDVIMAPAPQTSEYLGERIALHVREAQAAGNTTYASIRTYLLNLGEWVE